MAAGSATATIILTAANDVHAEDDETVTLTLVDLADYNLGSPAAGTVTISRNDFVVIVATDATSNYNLKEGSLRQAIENANFFTGTTDTVTFAIPAVVPIVLADALPAITDSIFMNGWSQGGASYAGPPLIDIRGSSVAGPIVGLLLDNVANSTIRGLRINGFGNGGRGMRITGANARNNWIYGNHIGVQAENGVGLIVAPAPPSTALAAMPTGRG